MFLSKCYYSVELKIAEANQGDKSVNNYMFNNFEVPVGFRRDEAFKMFLEIFGDKIIVNNKGTHLIFFFHYSYIERDFENGDTFDIEKFSDTILFEVIEGKLKINWPNWAMESTYHSRNGEVISGKMVKAKTPDGNIVEVYNDKICQNLEIDFDYFEYD